MAKIMVDPRREEIKEGRTTAGLARRASVNGRQARLRHARLHRRFSCITAVTVTQGNLQLQFCLQSLDLGGVLLDQDVGGVVLPAFGAHVEEGGGDVGEH